MARKEAKRFKALYFDLRIKDLEEYYSKTRPKGAYELIKKFLTKRNFPMNSIPATIPATKQRIWRYSI